MKTKSSTLLMAFTRSKNQSQIRWKEETLHLQSLKSTKSWSIRRRNWWLLSTNTIAVIPATAHMATSRPKNQQFQQNHGNTANWNRNKATQYSNQFNRSDPWQSPLDQWSPQHDDLQTIQWRWLGGHRRWLWFLYYTHGLYLSIFTYSAIELA